MIDVVDPSRHLPTDLVGRIVIQTSSTKGRRIPHLLGGYRVAAARGDRLVVVALKGSKDRGQIPYTTAAMACDSETEYHRVKAIVDSKDLELEEQYKALLRLAGLPVDAESYEPVKRVRRRTRPKPS